MSLGVYPVFESPISGDQFESSGGCLAENFEAIDEIAVEAQLTPFTAFADTRPIPDEFDGDPDELAEVMGESNEWFAAVDGRRAMECLADFIESSSANVSRLDDPVAVVEVLRELARVLATAEAQGTRFRLELG